MGAVVKGTEEYDLVVLGGGPAGAATAIRAAQVGGLSVALLERSLSPPERPGETLHPGVESLFESLGVAAEVRRAGFLRHSGHWVRWGRAPVRRVSYGADESGPWRGFQAVRSRLDGFLLNAARTAGVAVRLGCAARVIDRPEDVAEPMRIRSDVGPDVRGRLVVDATGGRRFLSRSLGIAMTRRSPPLLAGYGWTRGRRKVGGDLPELHGDETGWTWTAPVGVDRHAWVRLPSPDGRRGALRPPDRLAGTVTEGSPKGADVTWRCARSLAGPRWFLVGDAGMTLDPSAGHGVLRGLIMGFKAAHLAAAVVRGALPAETAAATYDRFVRGWFEHEARQLKVFYDALGINLGNADEVSSDTPGTLSLPPSP